MIKYFLSKINRFRRVMGEILLNFFKSITDNGELITLLVSMFPLIELKGAIPIGTGLELPLVRAALLAYCGSTLIVMPIFFLLIPIFNLLKRIKFVKKIILKIETVFEEKAKSVAKNANDKSEDQVRKFLMLALFIFVAVPFPVTGVWTGTAIAVFLGLKFRESVLPIAVGNLIAGGIITLLTALVGEYVDIIIYALFAIAIIMLIVFIVKVITAKPTACAALPIGAATSFAKPMPASTVTVGVISISIFVSLDTSLPNSAPTMVTK
jgi:uncharacterized membrane protein